MDGKNLPIIALDFPDGEKAWDFLSRFDGEQLYIKVGMELYYREGAELLKSLKEKGHWIFLDLKLHDIPNTVQRAMKVLAGLSVDMVNVHAAGGTEMMKAALYGLEEGTKAGKTRPTLIAVTQLTSTSEEQMQREQLIDRSIDESVLHYALLARESGLDGVVCSAYEASSIAKEAGSGFLRVTPGIRMSESKSDDQKRIVTPSDAREMGSSLIVIGRPVTQAADPVFSYKKVLTEWER
ncbi:MAG TPA: orotidine-5'-phosphate decarboxylase [Bacillus bacterium]|uniref:Orotidine 5'-phosphate decarboxylase n=1 Tax=Siminovitchia fordii TaxID=254759 RepID=A0ABQ4K295_9BACI|nr:orotidine-5'-phosphate decarboxylase [Siminovitchia fordii]GIN19003.1 orotidine 5'-phosphate decarboxylase [Siminovitchia fordii]HBZ10382.1 orotidine-5'-phosphate decarboxylase [Bacillus sp. (in: firmicutes)]